jgi:RNA polymerase sigma-70 factor (ECF subfamily)
MVAAIATADLGFAVSFLEPETVTPPPSREASLARSASRGDRGAFGLLVDEHKRSVYGLCLRLLGEAEEARDAAQETFARAYAALDSYDGGQPFAPWVLRIARNHCFDLLRRRLPQRQRVELDAPPAEDAPDHRELPDPGAAPADEALERAEVRRKLEGAIASLPPNYREAVQLFHVDQMTYREIAATMDVPIGTVMTWLHRARARLRETLEEATP